MASAAQLPCSSFFMGSRCTRPSGSVTFTCTDWASGAQSLNFASEPERIEPISWYVVGA